MMHLPATSVTHNPKANSKVAELLLVAQPRKKIRLRMVIFKRLVLSQRCPRVRRIKAKDAARRLLRIYSQQEQKHATHIKDRG